MSFHERRSIVNIISTVLITALYSALMIQHFPAGDPFSPVVFRFWGGFFLILVPVSIVARILIYIGFYIANAIATREEEPAIEDERDDLIELKATRYAQYVFAAGFFLAMVSLVVDLPPSLMFIILLISGLVSEMVSEIAQFYFYRRGF